MNPLGGHNHLQEPLVPQSSRARIVELEKASRRLLQQLGVFLIIQGKAEDFKGHPLFEAMESVRRLIDE